VLSLFFKIVAAHVQVVRVHAGIFRVRWIVIVSNVPLIIPPGEAELNAPVLPGISHYLWLDAHKHKWRRVLALQCLAVLVICDSNLSEQNSRASALTLPHY
jgi:hypothetical protein